jgi:hypothetical protein
MTDLHARAVTLADADGTAPDVADMIHDLLDALKAAPLSTAVATERFVDVVTQVAIRWGVTGEPAILVDTKDSIRTLPQPTDAELDAAALARPVVRALIGALGDIHDGEPESDNAAEELEWCRNRAGEALAAAKGAADADR